MKIKQLPAKKVTSAGSNYWIRKSPKLMKDKYDWVIIERIKRDKDKKPVTYSRIDKAIYRHSKLWDDLINAEFIKDDSAQLEIGAFGIFRFIIVAFIAVVLFAGLIYVTGLMNNVFIQVGQQNQLNPGQPGYVNLTDAAEKTFGQVNNSIQALRLVAITLIFSEILLFIIIGSFKRVHPAMFFVYVLIVFLGVLFSVPISNAYESLLKSNIYEGLLSSFTGSNWILLNLPLVVFIVGLFGGIFMFINIVKAGNEAAL